jgi:hypothetical protein
MSFFLLSLLLYGGLTAWLAGALDGTAAEWGYTLAHMTIAAALNAHLLYTARRRKLALLSPPVVFLLACQLYFSINGLKYFSPILLYPQFDLSLTAQFVGSVAGAAVLFVCALLLRTEREPTSARVFGWVERYWPDLRRLLLVSVVGSLACKVVLTRLGYGSPYTGGLYSENQIRSYEDFFLLLGNDAFGVMSLFLGVLYLLHRRTNGPRPFVAVVAAFAVLLHLGYTLLFLQSRMVLLILCITIGLAAEVRSRRTAENVLRALFLILPPLSLIGLQLTLLLGRVNVPEDTGMRLAIGAINRRTDLTDFATAMIVRSRGEAHDAGIVTAAVLNAVPRVIFPNKQEYVKDVYSEILNDQLGWPAYKENSVLADYQDSSFSAGVMAFGIPGFVLLPMFLVWFWYQVTRWIGRWFHGIAYGFALLAASLVAMRVEVEWSAIPLNFRQGISMAVIFIVAGWIARETRRMIVIASRPPLSGDPGGAPA